MSMLTSRNNGSMNSSRMIGSTTQRSSHQEADTNRYKQMSGVSARDLIAPTNGYRGSLLARGKNVKNHAIENRRAIKELERGNMRKEIEEEEKSKRALSKMKQFQGVKSRVFGGVDLKNQQQQQQQQQKFQQQQPSCSAQNNSNSYDGEDENYESFNPYEQNQQQQQQQQHEQYEQQDDQPPPQSSSSAKHTNYLRKKSGGYTGSEELVQLSLLRKQHGLGEPEPSPRILSQRSEARKGGLPVENGQLKEREDKDWRTKNKIDSMYVKSASVKKSNEESPKHKEYGEVPAYLRDRQIRWAEEERQRELNKPDVDCPTGMSLMPESERLETLRILEQSEYESKTELFSLPLTVQTLAMTRRKNELENKLREIEDAKKIFSRAKVYIQQD